MYIDANVFIFANFSVDKRAETARKILHEVRAGRQAITSALTLDEVMWVVKKHHKQEVRPIIEEIYAMKNLEVKEVPPLIPLRALDIMEQHHLKPRDAFHVAIMEHFSMNQIVSDDADFDKVKGISRIKL